MSEPELTTEWKVCPAGTLETAVRKASRRARLRRYLPGAAVVVAVVVGLSLIWLSRGSSDLPALPSNVDYYYGGIACSDVVLREQDYVAGILDAETRSRIDEHLRDCPKCRQVYKSRANSVSRTASQSPSVALAAPALQLD